MLIHACASGPPPAGEEMTILSLPSEPGACLSFRPLSQLRGLSQVRAPVTPSSPCHSSGACLSSRPPVVRPHRAGSYDPMLSKPSFEDKRESRIKRLSPQARGSSGECWSCKCNLLTAVEWGVESLERVD